MNGIVRITGHVFNKFFSFFAGVVYYNGNQRQPDQQKQRGFGNAFIFPDIPSKQKNQRNQTPHDREMREGQVKISFIHCFIILQVKMKNEIYRLFLKYKVTDIMKPAFISGTLNYYFEVYA